MKVGEEKLDTIYLTPSFYAKAAAEDIFYQAKGIIQANPKGWTRKEIFSVVESYFHQQLSEEMDRLLDKYNIR